MIKKLSSSELKSAIIGMVLGDAYIDPTYMHCRMDIYVDRRYEDFAEMKVNILRQVGGMEVRVTEKIDRRLLKSGRHREGIRIQTKIHPYLTKLKNIPLFHKPEMLSPLGLAIWYMDDGSLSIRKSGRYPGSYAGCYLATNRYPLEFVEHVQYVLKRNFGLHSQIQLHSPKNQQYLLRFKKDDCRELCDIISPHVVPSMRYKLLDESGDGYNP